MKIGELVSALEELGKGYRHAKKKEEPAPCIVQLLKFLHGKEELDVSELVRQTVEKKAQPKQRKKASSFSVADHSKALQKARSDGEFAAAMDILKKAKPTNDDLKNLIFAYTGVTQKTGKKEQLFRTLEVAYNAERRNERRGKIASETPPF